MAASNPTGFDKLLNKNVPHILEKIFLSLDYDSFMKCHKVCNAWSELLGTESFKKRSKALYQDEMVVDLFKATVAGNIKEVTRLLAIGININVIKDHSTPLMMAVSTRSHIDVVKLLLNAGADPNTSDELGRTPLHEAAINGFTEAIKMLLDKGADPNKVNIFDNTALSYAASRPITTRESYEVTNDVIKLLIDGGAHPTEQDRRWNSIYMYETLTHMGKSLFYPDLPD